MNRGMKKWAPYKSLNEQSDFIHNMLRTKNKIEKPIIFCDQKEKIDNILKTYHYQDVVIHFYNDGDIVMIKTKICKIDQENMRLYFDKYSYIVFNNILDIENDV